ncbi:histidine kinase [Siminovitchia sediminis]|uniref:Histidine kinase n=1 Tax=Siminovitchia sediminis TaxID=1274353 RepID=A0ABW4KDR8_9BACI
MKRLLLYPLPIAVIVYVMSAWWLNRNYTDIESPTRTYIAIGAAIFSGIISYFLFGDDSEKEEKHDKK